MRTLAIVLVAVVVLVGSSLDAAITQYDDLALWQAAVGPEDAIEDFEGFTVDTPFTITAGPVALAGGMSIVEVGATDSFSYLNTIEVAPVNLPWVYFGQSPNGSTYANMNLNSSHSARIDLTAPLKAWGADFAKARGGAYLELAVMDAGGEIGSMVISANDAFLGFDATEGEQILSIVLRGDSGVTRVEDLGMDNVRTVTGVIPEPSTLIMLGGLGIAVGWYRRRKLA